MDKRLFKKKVIESVEIIHNEGPDFYKIGGSYGKKKITDIIESSGTIWVFDEKDEVIIEIRNCPVVIRYKDAEDEE